MTIFLSGGAKNGKSSLAQRLAAQLAGARPHYYVATMRPVDDEDNLRIALHRADRAGLGFETVECAENIREILEKTDKRGVFLLDSVTALFQNELFGGAPDFALDERAAARVAEDLCFLCDEVTDIVFVSDFLYADAERYDAVTEAFRRGLAHIDRALAARCDAVAELCGGIVTMHKGVLPA